MRSTMALVGRNLRIYFRDRASVLLSLLSAVILLLLYLLFLGSLQVENLREELPNASDNDIASFVGSWVHAGIVMITTLSTGLAALGAYVDDRVSGRFKEFRVSPIRRWQLVLGYQISAVVVATLVSVVVLFGGSLLLKLLYGHSPSAMDLLASVGLIVLLSTAFAALSSFLLTFVSSQGAYTAFSTI
ncbi:MAG: ABC transporter permease, partial [Arachnia sp.]